MGKGEVFIKGINPLDVYIDPNSKDVYARDATYISCTLPKQAMQQYPEFGDIILDSDSAIDNDEDYPETNLAATEGQIFNTDETTTIIIKENTLNAIQKKCILTTMFMKKFSRKELLLNEEEYKEYLINQYVKLSKITGEEVIVFDEVAMDEF